MELFGRNRNGELVVALHDIAGHLCVQRGPRGIRQKIPTPDQAIAVAGDIGLGDETLTGLIGKYFGTAPEGRTVLKTVSNAGPGIVSHVIAFCDDGSVWRKDTDVNDSDAAWEALTPLPGSVADPAVPADPTHERGQIAGEIERWVNQTYWPNDRSAEAVRELAHAIRRNDLREFVDGEGCARYDNDEGDRLKRQHDANPTPE